MDDYILNSRFSNLSIKTTKKRGDKKKNPDTISKEKEEQYWKDAIRETCDDSKSSYSNERRSNKPTIQVHRYKKPSIGVGYSKPEVISTFNNNTYSSLKVYKKDTSSSASRIEIPVDSQVNRVSFTHSRNDYLKKFEDTVNVKNNMLELLTSTRNLDSDDVDKANCKIRGLKVDLLPHQVQGLKFLKEREEKDELLTGGLLCDDMGLGKTIQMIALMLEKRHEENFKRKPNLIVCPVSLMNQWKDELNSKAPELKTLVYHDSNRTRNYEDLLKYEVIITSYSIVSSEYYNYHKSPLYSFNWWRIILDEAHQIKSSKTKQAQACFALESSKRWCLTGTPIQNKLDELHSLLRFVGVSKFSEPLKWRSLIAKKEITQNNMVYLIKDLKEELCSIMLRRTKQILKSSRDFTLPQKNIHKFNVEFTPFERELYDKVSEAIRYRILGCLFDGHEVEVKKNERNEKLNDKVSILGSKNFNTLSALIYLLRLRQICCNWKLVFDFEKATVKEDQIVESDICKISKELSKLSVDEKNFNVYQKNSSNNLDNVLYDDKEIYSNSLDLDLLPSKFKSVLDILSKDKDRGTVIFSQFTTVLRQLDLVLKNNNFKTFVYTGKLTTKKREEILKEAKNTKGAILLCSLKCSSVGLNLVFANRVVIMDPYWNPAIQDQAIDRVYRIGQSKPVDVYELIVNNTVENKIVAIQERKRMLADQIISDNKQESKESNKKLSQKELFDLLGVMDDARVSGLSLRELTI